MSENPEPPEVYSSSVTDLLANRPFLITILYLFTYLTGVTCIIGVILAHVFIESPSEEWERTHYIYLIRTFWMLVAFALLGIVLVVSFLMVFGNGPGFGIGAIMALLFFAMLIITAARTICSMANAVRHKPMPRPKTLLI